MGIGPDEQIIEWTTGDACGGGYNLATFKFKWLKTNYFQHQKMYSCVLSTYSSSKHLTESVERMHKWWDNLLKQLCVIL